MHVLSFYPSFLSLLSEARQWALQRVLNWLSEHAVPRLVNRNGKVSLCDRDH
jgi:hypothetical protein